MKRRGPAELGAADVRQPSSRGVEFAWKVHAAITDWTAKVDTKAAIVLSLGGIVLGFFVTLSGSGRALVGLTGWRQVVSSTGIGLASAGVLIAAFVVMPRLNSRSARKSWNGNFIYFGHLRYWSQQELEKRLVSLDEPTELAVLSVQLIAASKIAWRKHRLLQVAMLLLGAGIGMVFVATVFPKP